MRHRKHGLQLGRTTGPRQALAASLVCHLIEEKRIRTTLSKARLAQRLAEKVVTLAKRGQLADRRRAVALLRRKPCVKRLFEEIAPRCPATSGHVRILKLGRRRSDSSEMAFLEWVHIVPVDKKKKVEAKDEKKPEADAAAK